MRSFTTERPIAVLMVFVAAVVFGWFSYGLLPVQLMPELSYPTITVRTGYPGAAPEEVEKDVSLPIEEALGVISGLQRISSVSRAGVSDVVLEFSWETRMADAVQDALERLDLVRLPLLAERPLILRYDPTLDPVMELSLTSDRAGDPEAELRRLRRVAELQVKRALEPIDGIAAVRVRGGLEEEIHVLLDAGKLGQTGLSIGRVIARLSEENINVAGGLIEEGRTDYIVRTLNEYKSVVEIADTVVRVVDGRAIRVRDLGRVERSHAEREIITRTAGGESVQLEIYKEADANLVALASRVKEALGPGGLAKALRDAEGVALEVVADRSIFIESSIREVRNTAVLGGVLAVLVLFLFLRDLRSTVIIGVSIPVSLLITFAPLHLSGVSLNIMSLGGLALGIGMLVDSSIVVLESIHRCREEGDDLVTATVRGTREVRSAVFASTLTTIGVFLPMVFVEGVAGQAFGDLGMAVVFSLLAALAVALYLIPMLASRGRAGVLAGAGADDAIGWLLSFGAWRAFRRDFAALGAPLKLVFLPYLAVRLVIAAALEGASKLVLALLAAPLWLVRRFVYPLVAAALRLVLALPLAGAARLLEAVSRAYVPVLRFALARAPFVLVATAGLITATLAVLRELDSELLPEVHQGEFTIELALPVGTPIEQTEAVLVPIERAVLAEDEAIAALVVTLGFDRENSRRSDEGKHTARIKVLLAPARDNRAQERAVAERIRRRLAGIPDLEARLTRPVLFSFKAPIEVEITGDDLIRLRQLSERAAAELRALPQLLDIETTMVRGAPEVQIVFDRDRLRRHGLNLSEVAERLRDEVRGREATRLTQGERRIPIIVRLDHPHRETVEDVKRLVVDPERTRQILVGSVADVTLGEGPSEVRRVDGNRVAILRANLASGASLGEAVRAIEERLRERIAWPAESSFRITGQNEEWERSSASLLLALALSVFLVYVIMAAQFESFVYPLIIMFTIPLAFFGSAVALHALQIDMSVVVFLGMIMLAGIVVNNAIVLVDYINQLKRRGLPLEEAVTVAGSVRLRPILMTTATTALGLLPMAIGLGDGAEIRRPLALTVISGLIVSTVLTLIVIPTVYAAVDRLRARLGSPAPAGPPARGGE